jgi:hypothetical protein
VLGCRYLYSSLVLGRARERIFGFSMRSTMFLSTLINLGLEILPYLTTESMQGHGIAFDDEHLPVTHKLDDNILLWTRKFHQEQKMANICPVQPQPSRGIVPMSRILSTLCSVQVLARTSTAEFACLPCSKFSICRNRTQKNTGEEAGCRVTFYKYSSLEQILS